jgi:hypothetical protein
MTSFRQIEANRRNAHRSTGPTTEEGKRRSRQNAVRHGLCAETVVEILEDVDDYRGFEAAVIADYDARTAVERELVLRLASLLWRLRRATAIETDLLRIQAEILRERRSAGWPNGSPTAPAGLGRPAYPVLAATGVADSDVPWPTDRGPGCQAPTWTPAPISPARQLTLSFQRLANLDSAIFERLGRYEATLTRQALRTILLLRSARGRCGGRPPPPRHHGN